MPPKKVAKKKTPKLVRPPLKVPSKITVKIGSTGSKPPKIEKNISSERKIELANEVALAQLLAQSASRKSHKPAALPTTQPNTQETVIKPIKKYTSVTSDVDSLENFEITPEPKKKRPGPKSKTIPQIKNALNLNPLILVRNKQWEVKGQIAKPITKAKNTPKRKKQLKSDADNLGDVLSKAKIGAAQACLNITATPPIKRKGRPKGSVNKKPEKPPATSKTFSAKEIKAAASMLEHALGIASQPSSRPNSVISNRSNLSWTRDISTESSFSSGTTYITATSNDFVRFNNKMPLVQVEKCALPKVNNVTATRLPSSIIPKSNNVTTHRRPSSVLSRNRSSSSASESSSSSSSSSDSELGGTNTMPELNLSTSSLTSRLPISDTNIDTHGRSIETLNNLLKNFYMDARKYFPHDDDDPCTFSEIFESINRELKTLPPVIKGLDPDFDAIIDKCDNFDSDLEAMMQKTYNPEKSAEHRRIAVFTEQNESENKDEEEKEDSRRPSYEGNHSETSSLERCRLLQNSVYNDSDAKFAEPCMVRRVSEANSRDTSINLPDKQLVSNINREEASPTDSFKNLKADKYNYVPFDCTQDDEDALSLYAESISGMESSKLDSVASVSNVSQHDVYEPKYSPTSCMREKYIYRPTKIQVHESKLPQEYIEEGEIISNKDNHEQEPDTKPKSVSISGSRNMKTALGLLEDSNRKLSNTEVSIKGTEAQLLGQHRWSSSYKRLGLQNSTLYRGMCFNNIVSECKKLYCNFPHIITRHDMDKVFNTIKYRLTGLNEHNLISEYILTCGFEKLKRNFCILFVKECKRRAATRILFEMAIDLGLGVIEIDERERQNKNARVEVLETALLHLNTISLDACDDLLKFEYKDTMMCDALLSCMANSQNFAQFKRAFVHLSNLMCQLKRPVDIQVASSILERVCILPGEDDLCRGMLTLMKNTDVSIFESSLAQSFEVQLSVIDSDVHEVYLIAKKAALEQSLAQPDGMFPATPLLIPRREEARHTSPDSTNVDKLPETIEPIFTRTINNEATKNLFKPPAIPIPKQAMIPILAGSATNRQTARGSRRGLNDRGTPGGCWQMPETIEPIFTRMINNEATKNLFKPPAIPIPKQAMIPILAGSATNRQTARGSRRGLNDRGTPGGCWQMICRNETRNKY